VARRDVSHAPSRRDALEHGVHARHRAVERKCQVVRGRLPDREAVAFERDPLARAVHPHLQVLGRLVSTSLPNRSPSRDVAHGDGNLPPGNGSVARQAWYPATPPGTIASSDGTDGTTPSREEERWQRGRTSAGSGGRGSSRWAWPSCWA